MRIPKLFILSSGFYLHGINAAGKQNTWQRRTPTKRASTVSVKSANKIGMLITPQKIGGQAIVPWIPNYEFLLMFIFRKVPVECSGDFKVLKLQKDNVELENIFNEMVGETLPIITKNFNIRADFVTKGWDKSYQCYALSSKLAVYHIFLYNIRQILEKEQKKLYAKLEPYLMYLASVINESVALFPDTNSQMFRFLEGSMPIETKDGRNIQFSSILTSIFAKNQTSPTIQTLLLQTASDLISNQIEHNPFKEKEVGKFKSAANADVHRIIKNEHEYKYYLLENFLVSLKRMIHLIHPNDQDGKIKETIKAIHQSLDRINSNYQKARKASSMSDDLVKPLLSLNLAEIFSKKKKLETLQNLLSVIDSSINANAAKLPTDRTYSLKIKPKKIETADDQGTQMADEPTKLNEQEAHMAKEPIEDEKRSSRVQTS